MTLDPEQNNKVFEIKGIDHTILYDKDGNEIVRMNNYLDIGLNDTMVDLKVNFIGALLFSIYGYLYMKNNKKFKLAEQFITKKV